MLVKTLLIANRPECHFFRAETGIWFAYIVLIVSIDEVYKQIRRVERQRK